MSEQLKVFAYRADEAKVKKLQSLNVDVSTLIRAAIDEALQTLTYNCPTCGQKVKLK